MYPDFEDEMTSIVDGVLLAEIRAEAARRARAGQSAEGPSLEASGPGRGATVGGGDPIAAVDHPDEDMPVVDGYGALREIGRGGFSRVYEALQFDFERWVAVKILNESLGGSDEAAEFERECRLMGVLSRHPNIVTILDSTFTGSGLPCIVMELYPDGSYLDVIQASGPLGLEELLSVAVAISGALATAHRQGVVHGDLKPQNLFRSEYGAALGDFGIASLINRGFGPAKTRLSLYYAAPEVIERGAAALSPFSDQYSLAATLYTLATGERPFRTSDSSSTRELLLDALTAPTPRLGDEFPAALDEALQQAMTREPALRHRDMRAFAAAVSEIETDLGYRRTEMHVLTGTGRHTAQVPGQSPSRDFSSSGEILPAPAGSGIASGTGPRRRTESRDLSGEHGATTIVRSPQSGDEPPAPTPSPAKRRRGRRLLVAAAAVLVVLAAGAAALLSVRDARQEPPAAPAPEPSLPEPEEPAPPAGDVVEPPAGDVAEPPPEPAPEVPPGTLGEIRVDGRRNGFVVRWEEAPDANPPILYYRVQWRGSDQLFSEAREMLVDSDETSAAITGLASDTEYTVRVAAENAQGAGGWTESEGVTVPDGVPDPPAIHVSPLEEGLAFEWDEPWDGGWPITGYVVEWEDSSGRIEDLRYSPLSSSAAILGLVGGEAYRVRVAAENENGRGGWVEETAIAAVPVPAAPGGLAVVESYRSLQVTWEDPPAGGPPITEYRLELSTANREPIAFGLSPDDTSAEIEGLLSGRLYDVRLLAVNGDAPSDPALAQGVPLDRVAFASDHEGRDAIYYVDVRVHGGAVAVSDPVRVTDNGARLREGSPSWSPDGGWIAFQRRHSEGTHWQVFVKNIATGEERRLVCGRDNGWGPDWSPDGSLIAYARGSGGNDIWTINIGTGEAGSIKDEYGTDDAYLSWSPDGDAIAFARRDHDPRRSSLYNSRNPREIRVLTGVASEATALGVSLLTEGYEEGHYSTPEWSPEGNEIAYSVSLSGSRDRHIEVMDRDGNRLRRLTSEHHDDDPSWSPNGAWMAFARGFEGSRGIYVVDSSGGEPTQLLGLPGNDYWAPSWAPNSDVAVDPTFDCRS